MLKYAAKRLGMGLVTLFVLATATFFLMKAIPGSPFGAEVSQMSAAAVEKLYEKYDLDKSIPDKYVIYIKNVLHNDFGESMTARGSSVNSIIAKALPITAKPGRGGLCLLHGHRHCAGHHRRVVQATMGAKLGDDLRHQWGSACPASCMR